MPRISVVVPVYNGATYLEECVRSVLSQDVSDLEVILVDDCSTDGSRAVGESIAREDARVRVLSQAQNGGTLLARKRGVAASIGDFVTLIDQDDTFAPHAFRALLRAAEEGGCDILHFGAQVIAESAEAEKAAEGMSRFLSPAPRELAGEDILRVQFSESGGFDWHVHHKLFRGDLAREAWARAEEAPLTLSDDLYASFLICSLASSYRALGDAPLYRYHLGRGETLGSRLSMEQFTGICDRDHRAYELVEGFAEAGRPPRPDWEERVADVRDRLMEHVMNEMHDNLPAELHAAAVDKALAVWPAYAVAAELYRFVRDRAYELFVKREVPLPGDVLHDLLALARRADARVGEVVSPRYQTMREAALRHLSDLDSLRPRRLSERFLTMFRARLRHNG